MKIALISDLHIKHSCDESTKILKSFFAEDNVHNSDIVVFLGDIFDLMLGDHKEYYSKYNYFFSSVAEFLNLGKKVIYFEGNHDLHLDKLFQSYFTANSINQENFQLVKDEYIIQTSSKKILLMHGDQLDKSLSYKVWKKFLGSNMAKYLASNILSYNGLTQIGSWSSRKSSSLKKRNFNHEIFKDKYRAAAIDILNLRSDINIIVCGHTHIKDHYEVETKQYFNIGYPVRDREYVLIENDELNFIKISE
jgi:UDP-2,3-diacylglucosamine hydrolase